MIEVPFGAGEAPPEQKPTETFEHDVDGKAMDVEVRLPTATEYLRWSSRYLSTGARRKVPDWEGAVKHIAREWFVSFGRVAGPTGEPPENSEAVRIWMLNNVPRLLSAIQSRASQSDLDREGNDASGSD